MISKEQLNELYSWALTAKDSKIRRGLATYGKAASFVNENVGEFENYMVTGNWLKMTRKLTNIRKKVMPDHIYKIYQNPEILYSGKKVLHRCGMSWIIHTQETMSQINLLSFYFWMSH